MMQILDYSPAFIEIFFRFDLLADHHEFGNLKVRNVFFKKDLLKFKKKSFEIYKKLCFARCFENISISKEFLIPKALFQRKMKIRQTRC